MNTAKKLYARKNGALVSGLCNGIADYLNVDVAIVRVCWVVLSLFASPEAIIAYAVLTFIIPYAATDQHNVCLLDMQKLKPLILQGDVRTIWHHLRQVWNGLLSKWTGDTAAA